MVLHIVRMLFVLAVLGITFFFVQSELKAKLDLQARAASTTQPAGQKQADGSSDAPLNYATFYVVLPALGALSLVFVDMFWKRKHLQMLSGLFFGILAGLVIAYLMTLIVDLIVGVYPVIQDKAAVELIKVLLGATAIFLCVSFVLQTKDDFRFVIPYVEFSKETKGNRPMVLDTSVIIDGRIADIAETKILESTAIVPRFVLAELQAIADSDDKLKRNRGRRGLDILNRLQGSKEMDIQIMDINVPSVERAADVDAKLVALAEHLTGRIVTNDYNLNKVAQLRGVEVININDLANALKPIVLPGETLKVKIIKAGEEAGQGVGYLEDGTMIVAEQTRDHIGNDVTIVVTSILQTSAGRMIFGKLDTDRTLPRGSRRT